MRLAWLVVLAACGGGDSKVVDASMTTDAPDGGACVARTIFLNRGGGMYTKAATDDAPTNKSSALSQDRTVPPPAVMEADWTTVKACVAGKLSTYPVTVTDVDPSPAPHIEVVIIDNGGVIGVPGLTAGAATTPCVGGFGTAATNAIAFASWLGTNANHCWDVSMAIGYTLGLDNVLPCVDLMSSNPSCDIPAKAFTSADQQCGDAGSMRACRCGGQTQNAATRLAANLPCP